MEFEWDEKKEQINIEKHKIDFDTAALVFGDVNRIEKKEIENYYDGEKKY